MLSDREINLVKKTIETDNRLIKIFQTLADPGRFQMFDLLTEHNDLCVSDLARILGISVPAASIQLKKLTSTGLTRRSRQGQMICYQVRRDSGLIKSLIRFLARRAVEN